MIDILVWADLGVCMYVGLYVNANLF